MYYEVIPIKVGGEAGALTYFMPKEMEVEAVEAVKESGVNEKKSGDSLLRGVIVEVPIRNEKVVGVIMKKVAKPSFKTKPISRVICTTPLPGHLIRTAEFMAEFYQVPVSSALGVMLPNGVEKSRRARYGAPSGRSLAPVVTGLGRYVCDPSPQKSLRSTVSSAPNIKLNPAQKAAVKELQSSLGTTKLLHGITGSGKTNVYLKCAEETLLKRRKSVILLVPEIALTGQLVRVFEETFGEQITLIHSKQTEAERHKIFLELLNSNEPRIVIGPRSALFAPLHNLGLIIVDEEHESTYSQENAPKYSAIRVASYMAGITRCGCILGSATPTVADYYLAEHKNAVVELQERAKRGAKKAEIAVVDFKKRDEFSRNRYFSNKLLMAIKRNLEAGQQTLIFHNRRGSAALTICDDCGYEVMCPNCYLPLTLHADNFTMSCHTCGHKERVPFSCPKCGKMGMVHKGFGTKLLETELKRLFPKARIRRFDADNKKDESLEAVYDEVRDGEVDILIGTQTVAKGLDLPHLATVGIVQADAGLCLPDFAAEERCFQLITQVIGRVGRGHLETAEVFIQTYQPKHPVITFAMKEDYKGFYEYMLKRRRQSQFPPFYYVAKCEVTMKTEKTVLAKVKKAVNELSAMEGIIVSPATPAFHERTQRGFTWQIVVRARSRKLLVGALMGLDKNFKVTFDPPSLL